MELVKLQNIHMKKYYLKNFKDQGSSMYIKYLMSSNIHEMKMKEY